MCCLWAADGVAELVLFHSCGSLCGFTHVWSLFLGGCVLKCWGGVSWHPQPAGWQKGTGVHSRKRWSGPRKR